jgi:outer membrane receptor for ferrienterochelin and colicins
MFLTLLILVIYTPYASGSSTSVDLFRMSLEELMNIKIVTAGKTSQKISDVPASTVIVTRAEIEQHGYQSLEEILQNIPGFYGINDYGEGGMMFGVRGFWTGIPNENIIILVNNIPQTQNYLSNHSLSEIPIAVEAINRIEVVRGPMSIMYGSGAFFGAINIITNDLDNDNNNVVSTSYGTSDTYRTSLKISNSETALKFTANMGFYKTDGINQTINNLSSNPADPDYKTGGTMSRNQKYLNISAIMTDFYFHLFLVESINGYQIVMPAFGDGHKITNYGYNFALGYRKDISEKFKFDNKFTYYKDRTLLKYSWFFEDFYGIQQVESKAFEYTIDAFYTASSKLNIQSGFLHKSIFDIYNMVDIPSFNNNALRNNFINIPDDESISSLAIYIQSDYRPFDKFQLIAGLRLEKSLKYNLIGRFGQDTESYRKIEATVDREDIEVIPRLAGIYKLNDYNILKLLYGKATKRPSFFRDYLQFNVGEEFLLSEEIETFEYSYQSIFATNYSVSLNLFRNAMNNLPTRVLVFNEDGSYNSSYSSSHGKMTTNGVELTLSAQPIKSLFIEVSATYQETKDEQKGHVDREVAYSPEHLGYLKLRYQINNDLSFAIDAQHVGSMETFWDTGNANAQDTTLAYEPIGRIGDKVDGYMVAGLNLRYKNILKKDIYLNLRISNLTDTEIRYPTFTNNSWADKGTVGYGTSFTISIGCKF